MPYFEAINDDDIYQIEDGSVTLGLAQVTTPSFSSGSSSLKSSVFTYAGTADSTPVVVIYNPIATTKGVVALTKYSKSGNTWTYYVDIARDLGGPAFGSFSNVRVLIFDRPKPGVSDSGVEFYNSAGKLQWSSNNKVMKIAGTAGDVMPSGVYGALVGGAKYETDIEFEEYSTGDWAETTIDIIYGVGSTSTGITVDSVRYDENTVIRGVGGSGTTITKGVSQPILIVDLGSYV